MKDVPCQVTPSYEARGQSVVDIARYSRSAFIMAFTQAMTINNNNIIIKYLLKIRKFHFVEKSPEVHQPRRRVSIF